MVTMAAATGGRIGVLIVNLGSPAGTDYRSMRRYLGEFLSDRRVIEVPRWLWLPLLNLVILSTRPQRSGKAYAAIWNRERNEAPLVTITRSQAEKLAGAFAGTPEVVVDWAMRYGQPDVAGRLEQLTAHGCDRVLVVPLYPQYAAATTATVNDVAFDALKAMRRQPALRTAPDWHADPVYIEALAASIEGHLATLGFEPEVVLASFHGVPVEYVAKGDPYADQCRTTVRLLRERLGWSEQRLRLTFQSRFGRAEWLQPYTDKTVEALAQQGIRRLAVVMPGFVADCLETLEEIGVENAAIFRENGGIDFAALPCLNDTPAGLAVLEAVVRRELAGWL